MCVRWRQEKFQRTHTLTFMLTVSYKLSEKETERTQHSEKEEHRQSDPFAVGKRIRMHRVAEQMSYSHRQSKENTHTRTHVRTQAHGAAAARESVSQSEGGKKSDRKKTSKKQWRLKCSRRR